MISRGIIIDVSKFNKTCDLLARILKILKSKPPYLFWLDTENDVVLSIKLFIFNFILNPNMKVEMLSPIC